MKHKFTELHRVVSASYERERALLEKAKTLREAVRDDAIALQKRGIDKDRLSHEVKLLVESKDKAMQEQGDAEQRNAALHLELSELRQREIERRTEVEDVRRGNEELVSPVLRALAEETGSLKVSPNPGSRAKAGFL